MCGIVGAVAQRDVAPILLEGLKRLEYRGYDSAGVVVLNEVAEFKRTRVKGKVSQLAQAITQSPLPGHSGIAHTRWATHGIPSEKNAHPHLCRNRIAVVHNGIIENHQQLRQQQASRHQFTSETDTEVIVHHIYDAWVQKQDILAATKAAIKDLEGAFALGVMCSDEPGRLITTRSGSPLVIGVGIGENFIASDVAALLPVTQRFIFLEEGDIADITRHKITIYNRLGELVERPVKTSTLTLDAVDRGPYRHYMLKEIFEQPQVIADTLEGRISDTQVLSSCFGPQAAAIFNAIESVQIVACGTSYHAGMVARYWLESLIGVRCAIEVASEFRYRKPVVAPNTLLVAISQSGETADTLAALREAKKRGFYASLAICNVPESSLVRESDLVLMTRAGPEIGVASTKAFTTQLVALMLLVLSLGQYKGLDKLQEQHWVRQLRSLSAKMDQVLMLNDAIKQLAEHFHDKAHALFLGRGVHYPIALEGALKLKEISYIHAEAYPAGELKHGPLALVDEHMPVIAVAPNNDLLEKLKSNLEEVRARGGELFVFAEGQSSIEAMLPGHLIALPVIEDGLAPILYVVPLQLLAYHVAVLRGTDVDQPRNLAKSVTVE